MKGTWIVMLVLLLCLASTGIAGAVEESWAGTITATATFLTIRAANGEVINRGTENLYSICDETTVPTTNRAPIHPGEARQFNECRKLGLITLSGTTTSAEVNYYGRVLPPIVVEP